MSDKPRSVLYSPQLLALAVELADYPFDPASLCIGEAHSRSCGSSIKLSCSPDLGTFGLQVSACAVGQAAAAIFARHCQGRGGEDIASAQAAIENWLVGRGAMPDWPDLEMLAPALAYPGRHGAILLPWRAAVDALSKPMLAG